jgi:hypothetical protein
MNCDNETVTDVSRWRKGNARYGRQNEIVERQYLKKIRNEKLGSIQNERMSAVR